MSVHITEEIQKYRKEKIHLGILATHKLRSCSGVNLKLPSLTKLPLEELLHKYTTTD